MTRTTHVDKVSLDAMDMESMGHERLRMRMLLNSKCSVVISGTVHIEEEIRDGKR
jgi:hypothetical protein